MDANILGFGLLWAIQSLLQFCLLAKYLYFDRKKDEKKFDHGLLYVLAALQFMEGVAFLIYSFNESQDSPDYTTNAAFLTWQVVNAGNLWTFAIGLAKHGGKFPLKFWWPCFLLASTLLGITYIILAALAPGATGFLFLVAFEPPQFIMLSAMVGIAGSYEGITGRWALGFFLGFLIVAIAHLYTILVLFTPQYGNEYSFPVTRCVSTVGSVISNYSFFKLIQLGVFTEQAPKEPPPPTDSIIWTKPQSSQSDDKDLARQGWRTYYVQPETVFSSNPIFQFTGYVFCGLIIFGYLKPNWLVDPIYLLYATMHPCVLLDYVPANLVAMPTFTMCVVLAFTGVWLTFVRSVLLGDALVSIFSGVVLGYYLIAGCAFVLVFVYPPSISTLGHSLFYMFYMWAEGLFMFNMAFICLYRGSNFPGITFRQKQHFLMYVVAFCAIVLYGVVFMGQRLLDDAAGRWHPPTSDTIKIDPAPQIGSIVVIILGFSYRWISPFTKFPIMFQMLSRKERWLVDNKASQIRLPAPAWGFFGQKIYAKIHVRRPLAVAAFFLCLAMIVAVWSNRATWTWDVVGTWTLAEFMNRLPGSAIVATLLVPAEICLFYHIILVIEHEMHHNDNIVMRWSSVVLGICLFLSCLCASCVTTPHLPAWFKGAEVFEGCLISWFAYHILLTLQYVCKPDDEASRGNTKGAIELTEPGKDAAKEEAEKPWIPDNIRRWAIVTGDITCATVACIFLIACMFELTAKYAVIWIVFLQAWSVLDARKVVTHFGNVTIVNQVDADKFGPWKPSKDAPKKLDEEQGGAKPAEKSAEKKEETKTEAKTAEEQKKPEVATS